MITRWKYFSGKINEKGKIRRDFFITSSFSSILRAIFNHYKFISDLKRNI